jgi:hypothetical protein
MYDVVIELKTRYTFRTAVMLFFHFLYRNYFKKCHTLLDFYTKLLVSLPLRKFVWPTCRYYSWQEIKNYKDEGGLYCVMFLQSFIKVRQMVQTLLGDRRIHGHPDYHDAWNCLLLVLYFKSISTYILWNINLGRGNRDSRRGPRPLTLRCTKYFLHSNTLSAQ